MRLFMIFVQANNYQAYNHNSRLLSMKNTVLKQTPLLQIVQTVANQSRKLQMLRKTPTSSQRTYLPAQYPPEKIEKQYPDTVNTPHQTTNTVQERISTAQQSRNSQPIQLKPTSSPSNQPGLKLPNIHPKGQSGAQRQNQLSRTQSNPYRIEGKRANMQSYRIDAKAMQQYRIDSKPKTLGDSSQDFAYKFMDIRPIKYQKSPQKQPDTSIKSMKAVRHKYTFKSDKNLQREQHSQLQRQHIQSQLQRQQMQSRKTSVVNRRDKEQAADKNNRTRSNSKRLANTLVLTHKSKYSVAYADFCLFMSLLNGFNGLPLSTGCFKAYVAKGNNSILIKNSIKNRFWWFICENEADANLYWSQGRDNKFIQSLKSYNGTQPICQESSNRFLLQKPKENKENSKKEAKQKESGKKEGKECISEYTRSGFWKLMSDNQQKKWSKSPYRADIVQAGRQLQCANKAQMHNHLQFNWNITNKKALFYNMKKYYQSVHTDPFQFIPLTFHVQKEGDQQWLQFVDHFQQRQKQLNSSNDGKTKRKKQKNLWIIKPGENSNQGCGIQVAQTLQDIRQIIRSKQSAGRKRSHIIQRYLMPLLYHKRKFDIRCYMLVTSFNGAVRAYWYDQGYIRTSSKEFTLKNLKNRFIHLTNDAVQKKSEDYGKYQNGNKISFADFEKYVQANCPEDYQFYTHSYPKMMQLAADTIRCSFCLLDSCRRQFTFEVFGLDFMIDEGLETWLIQVNNNPCLQLGSPLLARIIPNMIENAFKVAVDPLFPPPRELLKNKPLQSDLFQTNRFVLIFDSEQEKQTLSQYLRQVDPRNLSNIVESDEQQEEHADN